MMADQVTRMAAVAQLVGEQDQLLRYHMFNYLNFFLCFFSHKQSSTARLYQIQAVAVSLRQCCLTAVSYIAACTVCMPW
jgi:hypothetical protein